LNYQWHGDPAAADLQKSLADQIAGLANLQVRASTVAAGYYADHWIALVEKERLVKMRARAVVLATGACEQPAVFGNNDLPGVMLATAAQRLVHQFAVRPFSRGVVLTANGDGYRAALDLQRAGVEIAAVVDLRSAPQSGSEAAAVNQARIAVHAGHCVRLAVPGRGKLGLCGVIVSPLDAQDKAQEAGA
jgi:sarcosine oxidase, subunit alpha